MKKLLAALAMVFTIAFAQAQDSTAASGEKGTKYDYYPDANVYYDDGAKTYWYHDSATNQWQSGAQLPSSYSIDNNTRKNSFYYNGADVWKENTNHMKQYGNKAKPKTSTPQ